MISKHFGRIKQDFLNLLEAANEAIAEEAALEELEAIRAAEEEQLFRAQQAAEEVAEEKAQLEAEAEAEAEAAAYAQSQEEVFPPMEQLSDYPEMVPSSQMRKLRKRTQDTNAAPTSGDAANFYYAQMTPGQEPLFDAAEEDLLPQMDAGRKYTQCAKCDLICFHL